LVTNLPSRAALQKQDLQVFEIQQFAKIAKNTDCALTGSVSGPTNVSAAAMGAEKPGCRVL
jgi:hypothetical protein